MPLLDLQSEVSFNGCLRLCNLLIVVIPVDFWVMISINKRRSAHRNQRILNGWLRNKRLSDNLDPLDDSVFLLAGQDLTKNAANYMHCMHTLIHVVLRLLSGWFCFNRLDIIERTHVGFFCHCLSYTFHEARTAAISPSHFSFVRQSTLSTWIVRLVRRLSRHVRNRRLFSPLCWFWRHFINKI